MPENKLSSLLTTDEHETVFSLLGYKCQSLATTVVELYTAAGRSGHEDWYRKDMGILCLVKDNVKRSYFFRLYCPMRRKLLWEHEVYNAMKYITPTPYLHSFEAEDCIVGFSFANEDEGDFLNSILVEKLENKRQRRLEKRNTRKVERESIVGGVGKPVNTPAAPNWTNGWLDIKKEPTGNTKRKGKLSKADIGKPQDFRHVSHVGWDPEKGFDVDQMNEPHLKEFFQKAGVSDRQLQDQATRDFIYNFIEQHGGMEAVKTEVAPPVPSRGRAPPPPPPVQPPPPPHQPPPPPPLRTLPPRNIPRPIKNGGENVPPPPPMCPPPPECPPPPVECPPPVPVGADPRSALMEAIRSGAHLKPVSSNNENKKVLDSRGELMEQIRQGEFKLNAVIPAEAPKSHQQLGGLAGALAEALAKRSKVIHSDSSSPPSETEEDDDEWDD